MATELKRTIDQVCKEKGIDKNVLITALEEAIKSAVKKRYGANLDLEVSYNDLVGDLEVFQYRTVVDKVQDPELEISLDEAKELDPESELGDSLGTKMDISNLGRIAAQSARQVILQKMKSAEQDVIYDEFRDRIGQIVNGIVQRFERGSIIVNLGRTEAILPSSEQVPSESWRRGDRIRALIVDVRKSTREPQVVISRSHPDFLVKLFELEVPEISEGIVRIMGVAREPGSRSKIAVSSSDSDVDPVGACVGMRGSRVQAIVQELRGEKIDIIPWNPDPVKYVFNALAPAECSKVIVDEGEGTLEVIVPDDQLSLAIGRQGQNVRLAAKLMGWKIDVKSETRYAHLQDPNYLELLKLPSISENVADKLFDNGFDTLNALKDAKVEEVVEKARIPSALAETLIQEAKTLTQGDEYEGSELASMENADQLAQVEETAQVGEEGA
ncbi:Transcription termination protein NusA [Dissulfuribacter thermophilus]|uniref:Transcription termination/antitermination protein NusA n=1 Tax=Dissulfuribacter thermophilus TaxID=1156395 RepID=A0A1B9F690_9BACT|nr:transcription termination factor NusA [Dissulfuribacter thermophilus]OCC15457.1 Transcription termination protein NusA [Dissulfuribacter thermophilus]